MSTLHRVAIRGPCRLRRYRPALNSAELASPGGSRAGAPWADVDIVERPVAAAERVGADVCPGASSRTSVAVRSSKLFALHVWHRPERIGLTLGTEGNRTHGCLGRVAEVDQGESVSSG